VLFEDWAHLAREIDREDGRGGESDETEVAHETSNTACKRRFHATRARDREWTVNSPHLLPSSPPEFSMSHRLAKLTAAMDETGADKQAAEAPGIFELRKGRISCVKQ
jgi:hypothetical protein